MTKKKTLIISAVLALILFTIAMNIRSNRTCKCAKFKKFDEITIYSDGTFDSREDSICVAGGNKNGELVIKKFN